MWMLLLTVLFMGEQATPDSLKAVNARNGAADDVLRMLK